MSDFRQVTEQFSVSPQIDVEDVARAAREGFVLIINNRPDGEAPDQPSSDEVAQAAEAAGVRYLYLPIRGGPTRAQAEATKAAVDEAGGGKVLAFCRSGNRSVLTWAAGEAIAGAPRDELVAAGDAAGYNLRPLFG